MSIDLSMWLGNYSPLDFVSERQIRRYFSKKGCLLMFGRDDLTGRVEAMKECIKQWKAGSPKWNPSMWSPIDA